MGIVKIRSDFQQARWNEPIIYEMSTPGVRGIIPPEPETAIKAIAGDVVGKLPEIIRRKTALISKFPKTC